MLGLPNPGEECVVERSRMHPFTLLIVLIVAGVLWGIFSSESVPFMMPPQFQ
jgi:hypothetical protein